jgi:hypothetical protein
MVSLQNLWVSEQKAKAHAAHQPKHHEAEGDEHSRFLDYQMLNHLGISFLPTTPKLSDRGARRDACAAGLQGANSVTRGTVRCRA